MAADVFGRRNALVGWAVLQVARRVLRRRVRAALPAARPRRPRGALLGAAGVLGALALAARCVRDRRR